MFLRYVRQKYANIGTKSDTARYGHNGREHAPMLGVLKTGGRMKRKRALSRRAGANTIAISRGESALYRGYSWFST